MWSTNGCLVGRVGVKALQTEKLSSKRQGDGFVYRVCYGFANVNPCKENTEIYRINRIQCCGYGSAKSRNFLLELAPELEIRGPDPEQDFIQKLAV
jgi:hypothetical protein